MLVSRGLPACLFGVLLLVSARVSAATPANVLLSRGRTEPSIAIDPTTPSTIVVATNTNYQAPVAGTYPTAYFTSRNGGRGFRFADTPTLWPYTTGADPGLSVADNGTIFYTYLGETPEYCSGGRSAVLLTKSFDHGIGFGTPAVVDANPADDKPALAVRSGPPGHAHVFSSWTRWYSKGSDIWFARSTDGGAHFARARRLYGSRLDNFGSDSVVGPDGRIYVFWSVFHDTALTAESPAYIAMRTSSDDGVHFGPVHRITGRFNSIPRMAVPGSLRNLTGPTAVSASQGVLYVAWAQVWRRHTDGAVDANIEISRSTNSGRSWSLPQSVNDVAGGDRFMPSLSILHDGSVGVAFYDRRRSVWQLDTYAARVSFSRGFHRSQNVRVNLASAPIADIYYIAPGSTCFSPGRFFGDYIGTAGTADNRLCVVWADTGLHVPDETDVWFARVTLPSVPTGALLR